MLARWLVLTAMLAGCPYSNPAQIDAAPGTGDGPRDGTGIDSPYDPCTLPDVALAAGTLAGCASGGTVDGVRGVARFDNPVNLAIAPSGIAYVADFDSSRLRKVTPDGKTTTVVSDPRLNRPFGIIIAPSGYLYVEADDNDQAQHSADTGMIWKIDPSNGTMTAVLSNHHRPRGLVLLGDGRLVTADYIHHVIEIVDPTSGTTTPLAGTLDVYGHANSPDGNAATFAQPWDLVIDTSGDLIVTEFDNNCLRRVSLTGEVSDFAGTGVPGHKDGPLADAQFFQPKGIAKDASGALYITEAGNHDIRKIANGMVTTLAGKTAEAGYHDDADPLAAIYYGVEGLDVSSDGKRIVVADGNNGDMRPFNHVREIRFP